MSVAVVVAVVVAASEDLWTTFFGEAILALSSRSMLTVAVLVMVMSMGDVAFVAESERSVFLGEVALLLGVFWTCCGSCCV